MSWEQWRSRAQVLDSGGLALAAYELGDPGGRTLTFLHGYPSSSQDIGPVFDLLESGWRLVTLDFPGFGASAKPVGHTYSIRACADSIEDLWRTRAVRSTVVVAHDYGVSVAQELLARRAEGLLAVDVEAVVWMNGGLYPDLHRPTVGQQLLLDPDHGADVAAGVTPELFLEGLRGTWGERRPFDETEAMDIWRSMDDSGGVARMHDLLHYVGDRRDHEQRWRSALEESAPAQTFVWGDLDPVSGAHMIVRVEERLPGATIIRLGDVGHWPLLEAPDAVAAAISRLG